MFVRTSVMAKRESSALLRYLCKLMAPPGPSSLSNRELMQRFTLGHDEAAVAALLRRHGPMVLRVCKRLLRHEQDAEDVFQATFLILARKASSLCRQEAVGPWLYGVAYRLALKARSETRRRRMKENRPREKPLVDRLSDLSVREAEAIHISQGPCQAISPQRQERMMAKHLASRYRPGRRRRLGGKSSPAIRTQ